MSSHYSDTKYKVVVKYMKFKCSSTAHGNLICTLQWRQKIGMGGDWSVASFAGFKTGNKNGRLPQTQIQIQKTRNDGQTPHNPRLSLEMDPLRWWICVCYIIFWVVDYNYFWFKFYLCQCSAFRLFRSRGSWSPT